MSCPTFNKEYLVGGTLQSLFNHTDYIVLNHLYSVVTDIQTLFNLTLLLSIKC